MNETEETYVIDVICGAIVNPEETAHRSSCQDETYYFCCANCQRAFEGDPEGSIRNPRYGPYH